MSDSDYDFFNKNQRGFLINLKNKLIPEDMSWIIGDSDTYTYATKHTAAVKFGYYCTVDKIWTRHLAQFIGNKKVLEIGSGVGWLAKALREYNTTIIATDDHSWQNSKNKVTDVLDMNRVRAIDKYKDECDILILSWPYYNDHQLTKDLFRWNEDKPLIYIGEGSGGCCACESFFEHYNESILKDVNRFYNSWYAIHDSVFIGYYKK